MTLIAPVLVLFPAASGFAHTDFVSSDPADGAVLSRPPQRVVLTFTQAPLGQGLAVRVTGPTDSFGLQPQRNGTRVVATWPQNEQNGQYRVSFRVVAEDGHPIEGAFSFRIAGPKQDRAATPTQAAAPATEADKPSTSPSGLPPWLWLAAGAVLAVAVILVVRLGRADRER